MRASRCRSTPSRQLTWGVTARIGRLTLVDLPYPVLSIVGIKDAFCVDRQSARTINVGRKRGQPVSVIAHVAVAGNRIDFARYNLAHTRVAVIPDVNIVFGVRQHSDGSA